MSKYFSLKQWKKLLHECIWDVNLLEQKGLRGLGYGFLRICSIIWSGILRHQMPGHAAALSYSTLMALGPLVAITVMISGFIFKDIDGSTIAQSLNSVLNFIAAPTAISITTAADQTSAIDAYTFDPEMLKFVENLINNAQSGAVGIIGSLVLILISIQLIISIENTFNTIWGVERGRAWIQRIVFYWSTISLGAVLGFSAITLLSVNTLSKLVDDVPFGHTLFELISWGAPMLSFALVVALLTFFYHFMPNTHVYWRAALAGAVITALLLFINKDISFLYASRVIRAQSLYGSIGIIPVFMFGLYIFWFLILLGGQVTYAIHHLATISSLRAWDNVSFHTREALSLAAMILIARRFKACAQPYSSIELGKLLGVPMQLLNRSLQRLCDIHFLSQVEDPQNEDQTIVRYQPGKPLDKITLGTFKRAFEQQGLNQEIREIYNADPVVAQYQQWLDKTYKHNQHFEQTLDQLITTWPSQEESGSRC